MVRELYELRAKGRSIDGIARDLGISRNTVRRYLRSPEVPKATQRSRRGSKLGPYEEYIDGRLSRRTGQLRCAAERDQAVGYGGG